MRKWTRNWKRPESGLLLRDSHGIPWFFLCKPTIFFLKEKRIIITMNTGAERHRVYVACSLTHAPEEFKNFVEDVKERLRSHCEILCFKDGEHLGNRGVYEHDIFRCVGTCHLVVAICDHPSIGLGMEIGTQVEGRRKPCLAVAHDDSLVTDIVQDIPRHGCKFLRYRNADHLVEIVRETLSTIPIIELET